MFDAAPHSILNSILPFLPSLPVYDFHSDKQATSTASEAAAPYHGRATIQRYFIDL
jgi:hypothetical protein